MKHFVRERICDCIKVEQELLENESLQEKIIDLAQVISKSLKNGGKIILTDEFKNSNWIYNR